MNSFIDEIFLFLKLNPVECTTFKKNEKGGGEVPYNFVLSDNSTLSIRTNFSSGKVAPRKVGQPGYPVLNKYFLLSCAPSLIWVVSFWTSFFPNCCIISWIV